MDGVRDSGPLPLPAPAGRPARSRPPQSRRWLVWIAAPAVLGIVAGVFAATLPWGREVLAFAVGLSGIAWILRIASDWFAERVGPQRGVAMLGTILLGGWLVVALSFPTSLRGMWLGSLSLARPEREPYSLPPAGSKGPLQALEHPDDTVDSVAPLIGLLKPTADPDATAPVTPPPPADGQRGTTISTLRVSSAQTVASEGIVLVASVQGDGRPVRGEVSFLVGDQVVAKQPLRVQGVASQAEYRLVGLGPGLYPFRVAYSGSRTFEASRSEPVPHRVVAR